MGERSASPFGIGSAGGGWPADRDMQDALASRGAIAFIGILRRHDSQFQCRKST